MAKKNKKITITSLKKKAPKVPDFTCVHIDKIIEKLEKVVQREKALNEKQLKDLVKRLERLRSSNDSLRESGIYWYEKLKDLLNKR